MEPIQYILKSPQLKNKTKTKHQQMVTVVCLSQRGLTMCGLLSVPMSYLLMTHRKKTSEIREDKS